MVLKEGNRTISKRNVDIVNDGGNLYPSNWEVRWQQDSVQAITNGENQPAEKEDSDVMEQVISPEEQRILDGIEKISEDAGKRVIRADRHKWSDIGTQEYQEATGE